MRILGILSIIIIFTIQTAFGKEVRTRYGFYIDLPDDYISLSANMDELLKQDKNNEIKIDRKFFNDMMAGSSKSDLNIEYFFPRKKYKGEFNNIYIQVQEGINFKELLAYTEQEICNLMAGQLSALYQKNVKLYSCSYNPNFIEKKTSPGVYYMQTDGPFKNQRAHFVFLQTRLGFTSFVAGCEFMNCSKFKNDMIKITNSRSE